MAIRVFGRRASVDKRDKRFQLPLVASSRTFRYWYDTRYWGDQERTPHCVGYAFMHWLVNAPITNYIDPRGIYRLAQQNDEWAGENYDGTSVRAGAKILQWLGVIERYEWCWDIPRLIGAVLERGPVVVGTHWYEGMMVPDKKGMIYVTGHSRGGHAYLITGISTKRQMFRIKNSWGRAWGVHGRAWIGFADMEKLIREQGEVCLATERKLAPPRMLANRRKRKK